MALETFGSETAVSINHAVILCHDLLKGNSVDRVNEVFKAGEPPIWKVYAGEDKETLLPVVVIELGVG